jgi:hypothetical protein
MMINIGDNKAKILRTQEMIIKKDADDVCASHIFTSLRNGATPSVTDFSDLRLSQLMGYKNYLLSDGISHGYFTQAMKNWRDFNKEFVNQLPLD